MIPDVERKAPEEMPKESIDRLTVAQRLRTQWRDSKHKLYALHAPGEVECIAKGKARTPYEFGVKVSVAVTAPGRDRGGDALDAGQSVQRTHARQCTRAGADPHQDRACHRAGRSRETDGLLARNWLKGEMGDAIHAVLCGAGHNLRMILAYLRVLLVAFVGWLVAVTTFAVTAAVRPVTDRTELFMTD